MVIRGCVGPWVHLCGDLDRLNERLLDQQMAGELKRREMQRKVVGQMDGKVGAEWMDGPEMDLWLNRWRGDG